MQRTHLIIVDPQYDFCDRQGSLYVKGADSDMQRLSEMIFKNADLISGITITLDMHRSYHIAHSIFWSNAEGKHPKAYTTITKSDIENGFWFATDPKERAWTLEYAAELEQNGRYTLTIWPEHCIIGTIGGTIHPLIASAVSYFEKTTFRDINYIYKGTNARTEHYSAFMADVPIPEDPHTLENAELMKLIESKPNILVAGEALSHCVANTINDMGRLHRSGFSIFTLLTDASSSVGGFEYLGKEFINKAEKIGMKLATTLTAFGDNNA